MKRGQIAAIVVMSPLLLACGAMLVLLAAPFLLLVGLIQLFNYALVGEWLE